MIPTDFMVWLLNDPRFGLNVNEGRIDWMGGREMTKSEVKIFHLIWEARNK